MKIIEMELYLQCLGKGDDLTRRVSCKKQELLTLHEHQSSFPVFFCGSMMHIFLGFYYVVLLCVFMFLVPSRDYRYDFRIKMMVSSSLHPVVCRRARVVL
jgi:hypothetical protein